MKLATIRLLPVQRVLLVVSPRSSHENRSSLFHFASRAVQRKGRGNGKLASDKNGLCYNSSDYGYNDGSNTSIPQLSGERDEDSNSPLSYLHSSKHPHWRKHDLIQDILLLDFNHVRNF
uniref:Uncharacterized protein n=1 Tax=Cucumis melo TaxID=3656 RepID=A0A9I9EIC3_CUCME